MQALVAGREVKGCRRGLFSLGAPPHSHTNSLITARRAPPARRPPRSDTHPFLTWASTAPASLALARARAATASALSGRRCARSRFLTPARPSSTRQDAPLQHHGGLLEGRPERQQDPHREGARRRGARESGAVPPRKRVARSQPSPPSHAFPILPSSPQERDGTTRGEFQGKNGGRAGFEGKLIDNGKKLKGCVSLVVVPTRTKISAPLAQSLRREASGARHALSAALMAWEEVVLPAQGALSPTGPGNVR